MGRLNMKEFACMVSALFGILTVARAGPLPQAQVYAGGSLLSFGCRTLDSIDDYMANPANLEFSTYGGWKARRVAATGFFRVEQILARRRAAGPSCYG